MKPPRSIHRRFAARLDWLCVVIVGVLGAHVACTNAVHGQPESSPRVVQTRLAQTPARGPLRVSAVNPRYFADDQGVPVYLTGSHTWNSLQDWGSADPPPRFDYDRYLDFLAEHGHNFFRLYVWEQAAGVPWSGEKVFFRQLPYMRTGPGKAVDQYPRFDLRQFDSQYFDRLRARVKQAGEQGIYVSVMLFNGWSVDGKRSAMTPSLGKLGLGDPWTGHPFNGANNVNGIDAGGWGKVHTLDNPAITALQKAYVKKVIDTVADLDNVLYEISNESNPDSTAWQYEMIRFIHDYERDQAKQHPVGMTSQFPGVHNGDLWASPADWISPGSNGHDGTYEANPPVAPGGKVVVVDTDHIWGIGGSDDWVWKSFTRGLNPIFMDPYAAELVGIYPMYRIRQDTVSSRDAGQQQWIRIRKNLGFTRLFSMRLSLAAATPHSELASTGYCLADPGSKYLVYVPAVRGRRYLQKLPASALAHTVEVDLSRAAGELKFEWFRTDNGTMIASGRVPGGDKRSFAMPLRGGGLVLYVER